MRTTPGPGYTITIRIEMPHQTGIFGKIATVIGETGGDISDVDVFKADRKTIVRDITVNANDESHEKEIVDAVRRLPGVRIIHVTDRTFLAHHGGKIGIQSKVPVRNRNDLSRIYTPGVARVCLAIHHDKEKAYRFTIKRNSVAIVTDGSAVLGLGNMGPEAALPVMEGKAVLFKEFANVDAFPICISTQNSHDIIRTVQHISPAFGGINIEDISAPRCFEIEERLRQELDIPVFHDDQHGTAVVTLAALINAAKVVGKELSELKIVISGAGAAGTAICKIFLEVGITDMIVCDREGIIYQGRKRHMNPVKRWIAEHSNSGMVRGVLPDAMDRADVFVGVSAPNILSVDDIRRMSENPIVFALANPEPEIAPEDAYPHVRIFATGRSDYPNQINNMLCFPGLFRGLLDARARTVNEAIKLAAARAIASVVDERHLSEEYIVPSIFDRHVVSAVASAVAHAAFESGATVRQL